MTREEAIYQIRNLAVLSSKKDMASITEALNMAIEALEHDKKEIINMKSVFNLSDDLISREEVKKQTTKKNSIWNTITDSSGRGLDEILDSIPSADRPTGHWIENAQEYYEMINEKGGGVDENTPYFTDDIACSECLAKFSVIDNETERFDFCPKCGADMRGR